MPSFPPPGLENSHRRRICTGSPTLASPQPLTDVNDIFTIIVGPHHKFNLSRRTLSKASIFAPWLLENRNPIVLFDDEDPHLVQQYLYFLQSNTVNHKLPFITLSQLYVFGFKTHDRGFRNATLRAIINKCETGDPYTGTIILPGAPAVREVFGRSPILEGRKARDLMVELWWRYSDKGKGDVEDRLPGQGWPKDFVLRLRMVENRRMVGEKEGRVRVEEFLEGEEEADPVVVEGGAQEDGGDEGDLELDPQQAEEEIDKLGVSEERNADLKRQVATIIADENIKEVVKQIKSKLGGRR